MSSVKKQQVGIKKAAKIYHKAGLSLAPAIHGGKHPCIGWKELQKNRLPWKNLKTELEIIPNPDLCLITGSLSGIMVVDADTKAAVKWCDKKLPATVTQDTKKGRHYFFRAVKGTRSTVDYFKVKRGNPEGRVIDIRGERGIILLSPSTGKTMDPQTLADAIKNKSLPKFPKRLFPEKPVDKKRRKNAKITAKAQYEKFSDSLDDRKELIFTLEYVSSDCDYKQWFEVAGALYTCFGYENGFNLFCEWSQRAESYDLSNGELAGFWDSIEPGFFNSGTIHHYAKDVPGKEAAYVCMQLKEKADLSYDTHFDTPVNGGKLLDDSGIHMLNTTIQAKSGNFCRIGALKSCIDRIARERETNFLQDYFKGLKKVPKSDPVIKKLTRKITGLNKPPEIYYAMLLKWLLGSPVHVFNNRALVKACLIITGEQDAGKSSALRALVPPAPDTFPNLFNDSLNISALSSPSTTKKDFLFAAYNCMIIEFQELVGNSPKSIAALKAFISGTGFKERKAYGYTNNDFDMRAIIAGTTNDAHFFTDGTGNTRFFVLPVKSGHKIDFKWIAKNRDLIWGYIYSRYCEGAQHWLTDSEKIKQAKLNAGYQNTTPGMDIMMDTLKNRGFISSFEIKSLNISRNEIKGAMAIMKSTKYPSLKYRTKKELKSIGTYIVKDSFFKENGIKNKSDLARFIDEK